MAAHKLTHTLLASGSGGADAAADLAGNDPFAALLAQVAPKDDAAAIAGSGVQKGKDKNKDAPMPLDSDGDGAQVSAKSDGKNDSASAGAAGNLSAPPVAMQSTDPAQGDPSQDDPSKADSVQTDPLQGDPAQTDASKATASQADPAQADPAQDDPAKITTGKSGLPSTTDTDTVVDAKTGTKADGTDTATTDDAKDSTQAGKASDKKGGKKDDKKTDPKSGPNLAVNTALIPTPIAVTASLSPITLALATSGDDADDPVVEALSTTGEDAGTKGVAQGQGEAKTAKPSQNLIGLDEAVDDSDPGDALPKTGRINDSATDKKNAKPDPKQAGPQTPTKLDTGLPAILAKASSHDGGNAAQPAPSQDKSGANAPAPQAAAPQTATLQTAIPQTATPTLSTAAGSPPLPGMPAQTQSSSAAAPQNAQSMPATLQAAPQTPATVTPNLNLFALNIAARLQGGLKQFDITMDPAELGQVSVSLSIDKSGKTQAHLSAERPQTLALLQQDSSNLRIALRDAGLNLAQNGLNFSLKGQNSGQQNAKNTASGRGRALSIRAVAATHAAQNILPTYSPSGVNTRLDIHV